MQLEVTSPNPEVFVFTKSKGTAYAHADPINYFDPSGTNVVGVWITTFIPFFTTITDYDEGTVRPGSMQWVVQRQFVPLDSEPSDPVNPCARNTKKLQQTFTDLDSNILTVAHASGVSDQGMSALGNLIGETIGDLMSDPSTVDVIGGHINLEINDVQLQQTLSPDDYSAFKRAFSGATFGQRRDVGAATMHSDLWAHKGFSIFTLTSLTPRMTCSAL